MHRISCHAGIRSASKPTPGQLGPLAQRREFRVGDGGIDGAETCKGAETAIGARNDPVGPDNAGEAFDPLCDQLGVFYEVGCGVDHARHQDLVVGDLHVGEGRPLVGVTWVCRFEEECLRLGRERNREYLRHRSVVGVWPLVVAPADVEPHAVGIDVSHRMVESLDVETSQAFVL